MKVDRNEIMLYFRPGDERAAKAMAYARTITEHVHQVEWDKNRFDTMNWRQILDMLQFDDIDQLLDHQHPDYVEWVKGRQYELEDLVHIINHHPNMIKAPIAIRGTKGVLCEEANDILALSTLEEWR
jgi:arsenate reductase